MKKTCLLPSAMLFAFAAILSGRLPASAGEQLGFPPPDPPGTVRPAITAETIQNELEQRLKAQFEAAAGPSGRITAQQAKNANWGYVADHFAAIDRDHDGYVKFGDVLDFMQGSPAKPKSVQIVE
jgi:hypothetical protein